jgi:methyl-accepting chemotaxis protein
MAAVLNPGGAPAGAARAGSTREGHGFFAHHGLWAPGVRLFRALDFRTKAGIVSISLVLPLLALGLWQAAYPGQASWGMVIAATAASLVFGAYLLTCFYFVMEGGLREVERHLRAMTEGDLTTSPSPWGRDEAARLMRSLSAMQDSLRGMVLRVRDSSQEIVHSASEIAAGSMDLHARTEQTAANLEQSASAMEQISATVKNTAAHVGQAASLARDSSKVAAHGGEVMQRMATTMEDIHNASSRIGDIIGTIDGIAFQTNILALNAAVEAARAGEAGRGFAVVAQEVRALAQRSATAAREIKSLVGSSVEKVSSGNAIVRDAGATIGEIVENARRVNGLLDEISTSAREQALGVGQIGDTVADLDRMTQQNAALVEQTAAAASAMKDQALALRDDVRRFRLPEGAMLESAKAAVAPVDFDFDAAIDAHRQWKVKLRRAIDEKQTLDADTICRDDQCPLGKWIHGPGGTRWGSRPMFTQLQGKHAEFHQAAADVARKINAAAYTEAENLIGSGTRFSQVSTEVTTILTKAKRGM